MNQVYNFSAYQHSVMLADPARLDAYHQAIKDLVMPGMRVVEVGTGMGILSAFAAARTEGSISAIEYKDQFADLAKKMMESAGLHQVKILKGKSFDILLTPEPDILITETMGAIGPEEHIVEICHDFKKRHPHLLHFIPSRLKMFVEPIRSLRVRESERTFLDYFASASYGAFNFDAIKADLLKDRSNHLLFDSLGDATTLAPRSLIVEYILGETETPAFNFDLDTSKTPSADAYHLFFEAVLSQTTTLSTHCAKPETHWCHAYVRNREAAKILNISYVPSTTSVEVRWED